MAGRTRGLKPVCRPDCSTTVSVMGELRLYAIGIEEVRGIFGASPQIADQLRELARNAFAPPREAEPRRTAGQAGTDLPAGSGRPGALGDPAGPARRRGAARRGVRAARAGRRHLAGPGDAGAGHGLGIDPDGADPALPGRSRLRPGPRRRLCRRRPPAPAEQQAQPESRQCPGPHRRLAPVRDRARDGRRLSLGAAADQDRGTAGHDQRRWRPGSTASCRGPGSPRPCSGRSPT